MARGWESKSVEEQIEAARPWGKLSGPELTPEQAAHMREREGLELQRVRILRDLEAAANPRYKETLNAALTHLDEQLAKLAS